MGFSNSDGTTSYIPPASSSTTDNSTYANDAGIQLLSGDGLGTGIYYFMGGPNYAPSNLTPYQYGEEQGFAMLAYYDEVLAVEGNLDFGFIMADIEMDPTHLHGWNYPGATGAALAANQAVWQGFYTGLQGAGYNVGLYSDPDNWTQASATRLSDRSSGHIKGTTVLSCHAPPASRVVQVEYPDTV